MPVKHRSRKRPSLVQITNSKVKPLLLLLSLILTLLLSPILEQIGLSTVQTRPLGNRGLYSSIKLAQSVNIIKGGAGDTLTGTDSPNRFIVTSPGAIITNFKVGKDVLEIDSKQPLNFFNLVNPYQNLITSAGNGDSLISLPNPDAPSKSISLVTIKGVTPNQLSNSPESFSFLSEANPVVNWNEITFDSTRTANVAPARSTRYHVLVQLAIYDAVQGIVKTKGRQQYLQSKDPNFSQLPTPATGASSEAATDEAAYTVLRAIFTNPDNVTLPNNFFGQTTREGVQNYIAKALDALRTDSLRQIKDTADNIAAGQAYGKAIANELLSLRAKDGAFRDVNNNLVDPTVPLSDPNSIEARYQNGIESDLDLNSPGPQPGILAKVGSVGRTSNDPKAYFLNQVPINTTDINNVTTNSTAPTTAGAWRRTEDVYDPVTGNYQALAAPEWSRINTAWILPATNFFNNNVPLVPTLDSDRFRAASEEVKIGGSITDLPRNNANGKGTGDANVVLSSASTPTVTNPGLGATTTVKGVTSANPTGVVGTNVDETNVAGLPYGDFGARTWDGYGATSAERTVLSHVWANDDGSYQPNGTWQKITQQIVSAKKLNLADSAYTFALVDLGLADAFINIWNIKWDRDYWWRPVSGLRNADQIPYTADLVDPNWTPRQITPQHPCHPSGTSNSAGVSSTILTGLFSDKVPKFKVGAGPHPNSTRLRDALNSINGNTLVPEVATSADRANPTQLVDIDDVYRVYTSLEQAAEDARHSRIYSGVHYRFSTEDGVNLGRQIGTYVLTHNPLLEDGRTTPELKS